MKLKAKYNFKNLLPLGIVVAGTALNACVKTYPEKPLNTENQTDSSGTEVFVDSSMNVIEFVIEIDTNQR